MGEPVRCARSYKGWQCKNVHVPVFVKGQWTKNCDECRAKCRRHSKSETAQKTRAEYVKSESYKAKNAKAVSKYQSTTSGKLLAKNRNAQEHYVQYRKQYAKSPRGKAARKKHDALPMSRLATAVRIMLKRSNLNSTKVLKKTEFKSNADMRSYLESTWEPWMNWKNHGKLTKGQESQTTWQIGHRIPIAAYDQENEEDVLKCWKKCNIFAQDAKENIQLGCKLPPIDTLMSLRAIWPEKWGDSVPKA